MDGTFNSDLLLVVVNHIPFLMLGVYMIGFVKKVVRSVYIPLFIPSELESLTLIYYLTIVWIDSIGCL